MSITTGRGVSAFGVSPLIAEQSAKEFCALIAGMDAEAIVLAVMLTAEGNGFYASMRVDPASDEDAWRRDGLAEVFAALIQRGVIRVEGGLG